MEKELTPDEMIDACGGTSKTARIFGIKPSSVAGWRKKGIPQSRLMFLRLARPELFTATHIHNPHHVHPAPTTESHK